MKRQTVLAAASLALALGPLAPASALAAKSGSEGHISLVPAEIEWKDAPSIGPGAQLAVLEGDLKKAEPFTFRIKMPPDFTIPAHTHPTHERVTVISGTLHLGIGEKADPAKARAYPEGAVAVMPPGMPMYAFTKGEETVIQLHGTGPWGIEYLNPAEDPARKR